MASPGELYQHQSLRPGCIRILQLAPGTGEDPFRCYIETVSLDERPDYEAVSYVWGGPEVVDRVTCHDSLVDLIEDDSANHSKSIWVTSNLAAALRYLREPDFMRTLWIDQLCIDQKNDLEKSAQVSIMGSIFFQARETIAWLGPDEGSLAPVASDFFERLVNLPIPEELRFSGESLSFLDPRLERSDNPAWPALKAFGLLPYFERVWIVQELQLSSSVLFVWGGVRVANLIGLKIAYTQYSYLNFRAQIRQHLDHTAANRVMDSLWVRPEYHRLLDSVRIRSATDRRDKMYALINIMEGVIMPPADYTVCVKIAFFRVTKAAIEQKLNLLPTYDSTKNTTVDESWPSWVPVLETQSGQPGGFLRDTLKNNKQRDAGFSACGSTEFRFSVDDDAMELTVDAFIYDAVRSADHAGCNYAAEPLDVFKSNILPAWSLFCSEYSDNSSLAASNFRGFVETLIGGRFFYWSNAPPVWTDNIYVKFALDLVDRLATDFSESSNNEDYFQHTVQLTCRLLQAAEDSLLTNSQSILSDELAHVEAESLRSWHDSLAQAEVLCAARGESDEEVQALLWRVLDEMTACFFGITLQFTRTWAQRGSRRRFCFTRSGTMALGPFSMGAGDVLAIVYGDSMPYALRPVPGEEGRYRLLGECYVHDIMDGQAISLLRESGELESATQQITLV